MVPVLSIHWGAGLFEGFLGLGGWDSLWATATLISFPSCLD